MYSVSPRIARPRLTRPQQARASATARTEGPEDPAGHGIERHHIVGRLDGVENAVDHQRRRLELLERPRLPHPLQLEILDVGRSDLRERAIALAADGSGIGEPILGFLVGMQDAVKGNHLGPTKIL